MRSKDLTTVEYSVPTFETLCAHHDIGALSADQERIRQYEEVIRLYVGYAARSPAQPKNGLSAPILLRWRSAGLHAIKSMTSSEAVVVGNQLDLCIPVILENLYSEKEDHLLALRLRAQATEKTEGETALRRRMSNSTVQELDQSRETDPAAVSGSTADADRIAEELVELEAIQSLKQIFTANSRSQIRIATASLLKFVIGTVHRRRPNTAASSRSTASGTWATTIMEIITTWTPVQDRFVILVTAMETLIRSPVAEENLEQQLVLVSIIGCLLRSSINMIGLSVMDVLLGLVQHIMLLLQLGGRGSNVLPHHQQTDAIDLFQDTNKIIDRQFSKEIDEKAKLTRESSNPSVIRQELLVKLQRCIGDLATHIYYTDQISDMIAAILLRLKPAPQPGLGTATAAVEDPAAAAKAISDSISMKENPETDDFFSFGTARVTALNAITDILTTANLKGSVAGAAAVGRNRVSVQVWEGTQWLLRDEDRRVRRAYVESLLTWLNLEMSRNDLRVMEDKRPSSKTKIDGNGTSAGNLTRRAVSNASQREKTTKPPKSTFLQLLHLAVYNNITESPQSESDVGLHHLLLARLVEKLGVNAVKSGLPMIMRLQEDINVDEVVPTPSAKVNVGSLVHGYFWTLSEKFDFDTTRVGFEIQMEIRRRKDHKLWLEVIQYPPLPISRLVSAVAIPLTEKLPLPVMLAESLKPFDSRAAMVELIAQCYTSSTASPPASPPASPGRVFSMPIFSPSGPYQSFQDELPAKIKGAMLSDWTKDSCIATVEKESLSAASLSGSFTKNDANLSTHNSNLALNSLVPNASSNGVNSPVHHHHDPQLPGLTFPSAENRFRRSSAYDARSTSPASSSDHGHTLRVDDLKRVLAGGSMKAAIVGRNGTRNASPLRNSTTQRDYIYPASNRSPSTGSESIVSADGFESASEGDIPKPHQNHIPNPLADHPITTAFTSHPPTSRTPLNQIQSPASSRGSDTRTPPRISRRPSTSSSAEDPAANAKALKGEFVLPLPGASDGDDEVPPVPPLPAGVALHGNMGFGPGIARPGTADTRPGSMGARPDAISGEGKGGLVVGKKKRGVDIEALLGSIDAGVVGKVGLGTGTGRPPY